MVRPTFDLITAIVDTLGKFSHRLVLCAIHHLALCKLRLDVMFNFATRTLTSKKYGTLVAIREFPVPHDAAFIVVKETDAGIPFAMRIAENISDSPTTRICTTRIRVDTDRFAGLFQ